MPLDAFVRLTRSGQAEKRDNSMKPTIKIASSRTPDGNEMVLFRHDEDFFIRVEGEVLMQSRQHESELELARLGCAHLAERRDPRILMGGLGLGYTLRQCLDLVSPTASIKVCELIGDVIAWNRDHLGALNNHPMRDKRVTVKRGDVVELLANGPGTFDAIILDVDNGPTPMTDLGNHRLYGNAGVALCRDALTNKGCLAIWSADPSKAYERTLMRAGLAVRRHRVPAYKGSKSLSRFVWVAAKSKSILPPGGGEPRVKGKRRS
jgi:spermidine synthase